MGNNKTHFVHANFRYLREDDTQNPLHFINVLCGQETTLYYLKQDVLNLVKTAYSYGEEFYGSTGKSYAYDQIQLVKVVEIMNVLHSSGLDLSPGNIRSYENSYPSLSLEEKNDIRIFLADFFTFRSLDGWEELLDDLLIHAYKEGSEGFFDNVREPFRIMVYLEKLTEAIFLVYEILRLKESYPKASEVAEPS